MSVNDHEYIDLRTVAELQEQEMAREGVAPEYIEAVDSFDRERREL